MPGDPDEAAAIRAAVPGAQIVEGTPDAGWVSDPDYFTDLMARGVVGFSFGFGSGAATREFCAAANEHGMFVEVFTILDPDVMRQAAAEALLSGAGPYAQYGATPLRILLTGSAFWLILTPMVVKYFSSKRS